MDVRDGGDADRRAAVVRAIAAMRVGLASPHPLTALARSGLFSPFYFHRIFREITGLTPARFLAALRMAEARRLLLHTGLPVRWIGERVGYASPGTFGTQFARLAGLSPARFRAFVQGLGDERAGGQHSIPAGGPGHPAGEPGRPVDGAGHPAGGPGHPAGVTVALSGLPAHGSLVLGRIRADRGPDAPDPGRWATWTLSAGPGPCPVRLPEVPGPGEYAVLTLVVPGGVRLADALVDRPGSYLVGRARISVPTRDQGVTRAAATLNWPRSTDPPSLAITPIDGLVPDVL